MHITHELGEFVGNPSYEKECRLGIVAIEEVECPLCARDDPRFPIVPSLTIDHAGKRLNHEVVFNIDAQEVHASRIAIWVHRFRSHYRLGSHFHCGSALSSCGWKLFQKSSILLLAAASCPASSGVSSRTRDP